MPFAEDASSFGERLRVVCELYVTPALIGKAHVTYDDGRLLGC